MDSYGQALTDYYQFGSCEKLWINNLYGEPEEMPIDVFFRNKKNMPELEIEAIGHCKGKVLDIGAGAGSHALLLHEIGLDVTALEISSLACNVMKTRGLTAILNMNVYEYTGKKYDTLLLLMNGIGLCETIEGLKHFLVHCETLLNPGGQLIFDSSDIKYLYDENIKMPDAYYGEIAYQYEYKKTKSNWFKWLYIDVETLTAIAHELGWQTSILFKDEHDQYLAHLTCFHEK